MGVLTTTITASPKRLKGVRRGKLALDLQGFFGAPHLPPQVWKAVPAGNAGHPASAPSQRFFRPVNTRPPVDNLRTKRLSILAWRQSEKGARSSFSFTSQREADLSAERTPQEAPARIPCPDVDASRPGDPEATASSGPQAALCLTHRTFALTSQRVDRSFQTDDGQSPAVLTAAPPAVPQT